MSQQMRKAVEAIFAGEPFQQKVNEVLVRELGAVMGPMVAPAFGRALARELSEEFLAGLKGVYAGTWVGYVPKQSDRRERNAQVLAALRQGMSPEAVAKKFRLSKRSVQRIKAMGVTKLAKAVTPRSLQK